MFRIIWYYFLRFTNCICKTYCQYTLSALWMPTTSIKHVFFICIVWILVIVSSFEYILLFTFILFCLMCTMNNDFYWIKNYVHSGKMYIGVCMLLHSHSSSFLLLYVLKLLSHMIYFIIFRIPITFKLVFILYVLLFKNYFVSF